MQRTRLLAIMLFCLSLIFSLNAHSKARYITCPEKYPRTIRVPFGDAMIMQFPEKPKHSLPGKNAFNFQYIGKDIGVKSLRSNGRANLFVYLGKRRCAFRLITTTSKSDDIVVITYPNEKTVEAKYVDR